MLTFVNSKKTFQGQASRLNFKIVNFISEMHEFYSLYLVLPEYCSKFLTYENCNDSVTITSVKIML